MRGKQILGLGMMTVMTALVALPLRPHRGEAGETWSAYKALAAIQHGNLTIFPVVTDRTHDTKDFLTLDEGLRTGEVVVSEAGMIRPLIRGPQRPMPRPPGAQVNQLVLVNNSKRPLILLAGEILTGGKQDRVVGKDRIIPPESDPIDLAVFCVEPQRWVGSKYSFGSFHAQMAQPSVRKSAMADQDQGKVWSEVRASALAMRAAASPPAASAIDSTSSYAGVMGNEEVKQRVEAVAAPLEQSYQGVMRELRDRNAVGVVVAVNDQIIWADLFASTALLESYWPKLIRSYAAEALTRSTAPGHPDLKAAQAFLQAFEARRETVESEPGVYRRTELEGEGFTAFELTTLLPGTGFNIHIAKMAE
jgi:hypothetical protein